MAASNGFAAPPISSGGVGTGQVLPPATLPPAVPEPPPGASSPSRTVFAFEDRGHPLAIWSRSSGASEIVPSSLLDGAGPLLSGLRVPPEPVVTGSPLSFSVTAIDGWSPVTSIVWDFGDGTTAPGGAVSHVYATAGPKTLTVTATDAAGNASTATATIIVTGAATDGAGPKITSAFVYDARLRPSSDPGAPFVAPTDADPGHGTTLAVTTSEAGLLQIAVQRAQIGRQRGGRCLLRRQFGPSCVILTTLRGAYGSRLPEGTTTLRFTGRLAGSRLLPGSYRLLLTLTDEAGNRSVAARIVFQVIV